MKYLLGFADHKVEKNNPDAQHKPSRYTLQPLQGTKHCIQTRCMLYFIAHFLQAVQLNENKNCIANKRFTALNAVNFIPDFITSGGICNIPVQSGAKATWHGLSVDRHQLPSDFCTTLYNRHTSFSNFSSYLNLIESPEKMKVAASSETSENPYYPARWKNIWRCHFGNWHHDSLNTARFRHIFTDVGILGCRPIPVAALFKAWVRGRLFAGTAGSNSAGGMHDCLLRVFECCQVKVSETDWSLVQWSPTECGVSEYNPEASKRRKPRSTRGCRATERKSWLQPR
jgi:hypothetical protein